MASRQLSRNFEKKEVLSLKRRILVKNISNLSDARYCAAMGVQVMGFVVDPLEPEYTSPETILELKEWVEGVEIALQVGNLEEKTIIDLIDKIQPDSIIISDKQQVNIKNINCKIYFYSDSSNSLENEMELVSQYPDIEGYIFKIDDPNKEKLQNESLHKMNSLAQKSVFVEMPNLEDHIEEFSNAWENIGYVLSGGKETAAGFKDFYELAPVLEYLEDR